MSLLRYLIRIWTDHLRILVQPPTVTNLIFSKTFTLILGSTQPPIQWASWALSLGVKRPGRQAVLRLHPYAFMTHVFELKIEWIYTATPFHKCFHGLRRGKRTCLHWDNLKSVTTDVCGRDGTHRKTSRTDENELKMTLSINSS
jgi:hypothetical protein